MSTIKKHKKPMALISIFVLIVSLAAILVGNVAAVDLATVTIDSATGFGGENVTIPVTLSNSAGLTGVDIEIQYDSSLVEPVSLTPGNLAPLGLSHNLAWKEDHEPIIATWFLSMDGSGTILNEGTLFTLEFSLKDNVEGVSEFEILKLLLPGVTPAPTHNEGSITVWGNKLPQIDQPQWDGTKITWTPTEHPELSYYALKLYKKVDVGEDEQVSALGFSGSPTEHDFADDLNTHKPGHFYVTVQAMAQAGFEHGEPSEPSPDKTVSVQLGTVGQPQWGAGWTITWTGLSSGFPNYGEGVNYYSVTVYGPGGNSQTYSAAGGADAREFNVPTNWGPGDYTVMVRAVGTAPLYTMGDPSEHSPEKFLAGPLPEVDSLAWHATEPGVITWTDNTDATGYHVRLHDNSNDDVIFDNAAVPAGTTSYDLLEEMRSEGAGEYYASIKALGDGDNFTDSDWFETADTKEIIKLDPPAGLEFVAPGVATWNPVANNSGYVINLHDPDMSYWQRTSAVESEDFSGLIRDNINLEGDYYVEVRAMGTGYYLTSEFATSDPLTFERLNTPTNVAISDAVPAGIVTWDNHDANADEHRIFIYRNGSDFSQTTDTNILSTIRNGAIDVGGTADFHVTVRAYADTDTLYLNSQLSDPSDPVTVQPLDTPTGLNWDGHTIKWTNVSGAVDYRVQLYIGEDTFVQGYDPDDGAAGVDCSSDIDNTGSGYYTAIVRANANTDSLFLNSDWAESPVLPVAGDLNPIANLVLDEFGVASWDEVSGATHYEVALWSEVEGDDQQIGDTRTVTDTNSDFLAALRAAGEGTYYVTVQATSTDPLFDPSPVAESNRENVTTLASPTVTLDDEGRANWDAANAADYHVRLFKDDTEQVAGIITTGTSYSFLSAMREEPGDYHVEAIARNSNSLYLDSAAGVSNLQEVVQLDQVAQPDLDNFGVATWTNLANGATDYSVQLFKGGVAEGSPVTAADGVAGVDLSAAITAAGFGTYTVTVTALGDEYLLLDGPESDPSASVNHDELGSTGIPAWDGRMLEWEYVDGADGYEVTLYLAYDDQLVDETFTTESGTDTQLVFDSGEMDPMGFYYATVRALGELGSLIVDGPVSAESDYYAVSEPVAGNGNGIETQALLQNGNGNNDEPPFPVPDHGVMAYLPLLDAMFAFGADEPFEGVVEIGSYDAAPGLGSPSGRSPAGIFFDITPGDGMPDTLLLVLALVYDDLPSGMIPGSLLFFHYDVVSGWEMIDTEVDTEQQLIIAWMEDFSTFGVFGRVEDPVTPPTQPTPPTMGLLPYILFAALLMAGLGALWVIRRRRYAQQ